MASTYLTRTFGSGNRKKFTLSMWVKLSGRGTGNNNALLVCGSSGGNEATISFGSDNLTWTEYTPGGGSVAYLSTSKLFRDYSAWYHLVFVWDTANATANDRMKIYVNGVQETSFGGRTNPTLNYDATLNTNIVHEIGRQTWNSSGLFNGSMSHIHFIDGTTYDATAFGEYDANGVWKIKTSPSVTYGTNGFFILKDGNSVTDQSGNSNNFTVGGGTLTKTEDNPSNVFATMNALSKSLSNVVLSKGNTIIRNDSGNDGNVLGTIALGNGKYYWETYKYGGGNTGLGITLASVDGSNHAAIHGSRVNYYQDGYIYQNGFGLSDINTGVTYSDTDIISVSVDTENGTIKFYKNGVLVNNSSQTNSVFTYAQNELIPFWYCSNGGEWRTNLGNGYFGTTAVSSAGTNASGIGIFEYDVPANFTALSTKGLNL